MRVTKGNTPPSPQSTRQGGVFELGGALAAEDAQQLHVLADEDAYEGFPALKGVMGFVEDFAALGSMPCVDELV